MNRCKKVSRSLSDSIAPSLVLEKTVGFKRRCFVQYLWRGAKEADKRRVEFEYHSMMNAKMASGRQRRGTIYSESPRMSVR